MPSSRADILSHCPHMNLISKQAFYKLKGWKPWVNGLITSIDANGRVQLPLAIRYGLDLCTGDRIAIDHLGDGTIILKKIDEGAILKGADRSNSGRERGKAASS